MRILIIEDEKELSLTMKEGLAQFGFICDLSFCGNDGEEKVMINEYDALLLDLNLPDHLNIVLHIVDYENVKYRDVTFLSPTLGRKSAELAMTVPPSLISQQKPSVHPGKSQVVLFFSQKLLLSFSAHPERWR